MHWDLVGRAALPLGVGTDAPGRIVWRPGGVALNVALGLATLGRRAVILAAVGRDAAGDLLLAEAAARGVDCRHVARIDGPGDGYLALEDPSGELFAAVADCAMLEHAADDLLRPLRDGALGRWSGHVVIDGNLPQASLRALLDAPALVRATLALAPASPAKAARIAAVAPRRATLYLNRAEAEAICGRAFADSAAAASALCASGWLEAVVTDGPAAAAHAGPAGLAAGVPPTVTTRGVTGAGDAFVAAHLVARTSGADPEAALAAALDAAARHVAREAQ